MSHLSRQPSADAQGFRPRLPLESYVRPKNYMLRIEPDQIRLVEFSASWNMGRLLLPRGVSQPNGRAMETDMGNALLDSYLARIGSSDRAIMYVTQASLRHGLTW